MSEFRLLYTVYRSRFSGVTSLVAAIKTLIASRLIIDLSEPVAAVLEPPMIIHDGVQGFPEGK